MVNPRGGKSEGPPNCHVHGPLVLFPDIFLASFEQFLWLRVF